ncbi:MAG: glycoside hydrolase family 9 protein [Victivallaceae bacterium]|nr:glycoside hydrolase family 9 protein [Victivallaceae bacterium]
MRPVIRYLKVAAVTVSIIFGAAASGSALDDVLAVPRRQEPARPLTGRLKVFPLTAEYVAIAGDYDRFITDRIMAAYGDKIRMAEQYEKQGKIKEFSYRFICNFSTAEILAEYMKAICAGYQARDHFKFKVNGVPRAVSANGYWINAVGIKRLPRADGAVVQTSSGELVPFAYLKLAEPLKNGDRVEITGADGETATFVYDENATVSYAIKVNQEGYLPDSGRKYGYLGLWMGSLGALPSGEFAGREFYLRRASDNAVVFTGRIALRSDHQSIERSGVKQELDGEVVCELDFSDFTGPAGKYYLQVPGVGRSWDFSVAPDALARAFYVQMRGLFHQRSGIAKTSEYTQWTYGKDHPLSWRGGFVPNDRQYAGKGGRMFDSAGVKVDVKHFDMVRATATDEELPNVYGGWWDAGDFDRRPHHFRVVDALLSAYLLYPRKFFDGQLDIPESGNGVPDIVDEAAWGVDVWRRAQNAKGGVGCWLEATSHPASPDPDLDTQRYYLALPTRESTIMYCAYAARLARAYKTCGAEASAKLFHDSAVRAWAFATDPANTLHTSFEHPVFGAVTYSEPDELPPEWVFKAALNLYMYDRDPAYEPVLDAAPINKIIEKLSIEHPAYFLSELVEDDSYYFMYSKAYRALVKRRAEYFRDAQEELAYRNVNWKTDNGYFCSLGWGAGLPFYKGSYIIMQYAISGDPRYRDAALMMADWMLGANPMGRSMTTGLGKVYPVRILSLPMWAREPGRCDPIPGITPYTYSGMNNYYAASRIFCLIYEPRNDHRFAGCYANLLPDSMGGGREISQSECYKIIQSSIPLWRRFANLEGLAVNQNEFTVWETMAPACAAYAILLPDNWMPPPDWKKREPVKDISDIEGHIFLP